jgi:hypothetical protein
MIFMILTIRNEGECSESKNDLTFIAVDVVIKKELVKVIGLRQSSIILKIILL